MRNIKISLSTKSITAAIKEVKKYKKELESKVILLVKALTEQGVKLAQLNASYMSIYDSGELVNGIEAQYMGGKVGVVASTAPHSVFCEFGTGIVGKRSPHPKVALLGWKYDVNNHEDLGWFYPKGDGTYGWTKGMPARPYMYETAELLHQFVEPISREVFK